MAIKIAHETRFGDTYAEAYSRITSLSINYVSEYADVSICTYRSEQDRANGKDPVSAETIRYTGEKFEDFFREISLDKIDARVNPLYDVYIDLTQDETRKYKDGEKLFDVLKDENDVDKEVSKSELIKAGQVDL